MNLYFQNHFNQLKNSVKSNPSQLFWLAIILFITLLSYLPALNGSFLNFDDHRIVNQSIITEFNLENFQKIFSGRNTGFHFSWLTLLSYQLNWMIHPEYSGFIFFSVFLYLMIIILFWKILREFEITLGFAVLTTLLFTLSPIHANIIVWQSARWHLVSMFCCLLSAWNYLLYCHKTSRQKLKWTRYICSVSAFALIIDCRPMYICFPVLLIILDYIRKRPVNRFMFIDKILFFGVSTGNLLILSSAQMLQARIDSKWLGGSLWNTILTDFNINLEYFRQLFIPSPQTLLIPVNPAKNLFFTNGSSDLFLFQIPPVFSLLIFSALIGIVIFLYRKKQLKIPFFLLLAIFITLLTVQNIPPRKGIAGVFAYRYAVFATLFAAPLTALIIHSILIKLSSKKALKIIFIVLTSIFIFRNVHVLKQSIFNFKNSENLWKSHIEILPDSRSGYYYLGKVYQKLLMDPYKAVIYYQLALQKPGYWGAKQLKLRLIEVLIQIKDWNKALKIIESISPQRIVKSKTLQRLRKKIYDHLYKKTDPVKRNHEKNLTGPVLLVDQVHSIRHSPQSQFSKDSIEYNVVQGYGHLLNFLKDLGFKVRLHNYGRFTKETLKNVDVLLIGIMSFEALKLNSSEIKILTDFVRNGGGLHLVVDHTNAYDNAIRANNLLSHFKIQVAFDLVIDDSFPKDSWHSPESFTSHPVTKDLKTLVHQAGCSLITDHGIAFTKETAWADRGDPKGGLGRFGNKKQEAFEKTGKMPVLAAVNYGKGRVVVTTDCNLYANAWLFSHDNYKLARNAFCWLSQKNPFPVLKQETEILVHEAFSGYFRINWMKNRYYSFFVNFGHFKNVRTYLSENLSFDKNAIFLFDRVVLSPSKTEQMIQFIRQGGILVYLCTEKNFKSIRTEFLKQFQIQLNFHFRSEKKQKFFPVTGNPVFCANVQKLPRIPDCTLKGAVPVVYSETDPSRIYVAKKSFGKGVIILIPFKKIFKTKYMGRSTATRNKNMRQHYVRRLQENIVRFIETHSGNL